MIQSNLNDYVSNSRFQNTANTRSPSLFHIKRDLKDKSPLHMTMTAANEFKTEAYLLATRANLFDA